MSTINKKPYAQSAVESLSDADRTVLAALLDGSQSKPTFRSLVNPTYALDPEDDDEGASYVSLETAEGTYNGYFIATDDYCCMFAFVDDHQPLAILEIDPVKDKPKHVQEELTILELRTIVGLDAAEVDISGLAEKSYVDDVAESIAPEYDATDTYAVGDIAIHEGKLYRCSTAIASAEDWTAAHWTQTDVKEYVDSHKPEAISYLTTAPSSTNANGLKFVVLDEEPSTYYDGYYYIITEANE